MFFDVSKKIVFYFGNKSDGIPCYDSFHDKDFSFYFNVIAQRLGAKDCFFLKQIHGNRGVVIKDFVDLKGLDNGRYEGDYSITSQRGLALGIVTADCMPLVFYDEVATCVGIIHVGWKGALYGVVQNALRQLQVENGGLLERVHVAIGPLARVCCYEVKSDFILLLSRVLGSFACKYYKKIMTTFYFDLLVYVIDQLIESGVKQENIDLRYALCTICNEELHSYRKKGRSAGRNISAIMLL